MSRLYHRRQEEEEAAPEDVLVDYDDELDEGDDHAALTHGHDPFLSSAVTTDTDCPLHHDKEAVSVRDSNNPDEEEDRGTMEDSTKDNGNNGNNDDDCNDDDDQDDKDNDHEDGVDVDVVKEKTHKMKGGDHVEALTRAENIRNAKDFGRSPDGTGNNTMNAAAAAASVTTAQGELRSKEVAMTTVSSFASRGGIYIPPFRRRLMDATTDDTTSAATAATSTLASSMMTMNNSSMTNNGTLLSSKEHQRQQWYQLQKNIRGTINRLNTQTLRPLLLSLFQKPNTNLLRGKGILAKSLIRSATISPSHAPVYASFLAVIHSKLPEIGELVLARSILLFRKSYARQDRDRTLALVNFIACMFNQGMCHEILCLQILTLLLADQGGGGGSGDHRGGGGVTDESVEVAVHLVKMVGKKLMECSPAGLHAVMERFRSLLHEGQGGSGNVGGATGGGSGGGVSRRVQYKLQNILEIRKNKFQEFPSLIPELDLVEVEDQIMLEMGLDDEDLDMQESLDVFEYDEDWAEHERQWMEIQKELSGGNDDDSEEGEEKSENGSGTGGESTSEDEEEEEDEEEDGAVDATHSAVVALGRDESKPRTVIEDMTEKDLIHLRRTIYLTIMSSATFEECAHKLSKMDIPSGKEMELINMIIECCSQERTFLRYYGLIASRFCLLHKRWRDAFHQAFIVQYNTIHRLETNKLRNVAKLFAHLLHTDSLPWSCLSVIHLNEDETTSSSRIFLKILVQEMAQAMGMERLLNRFETKDPEAASWFQELFPRDHNQPRKTRYAINFFTSIGLGPLTDGLREHLRQAPKLIRMQAEAAAALENNGKEGKDAVDSDDVSSVLSSSSSSLSSTSSSSSSSSSSRSSSYDSSSSSTTTYSSDSDDSRRRRRRSRRRNKTHRRRRRSPSEYSSTSTNDSSSRSYNRHDRRDSDRQTRRSYSKTTPRDRTRKSSCSSSDSSSVTQDSRRGHRTRGPHHRRDRYSRESSPRSMERDHSKKNPSSNRRHRTDSSTSPMTSSAKYDSRTSTRDSEKKRDDTRKRSSEERNGSRHKKRKRSFSESSSTSSRSRDDLDYDSSSRQRRRREEGSYNRR